MADEIWEKLGRNKWIRANADSFSGGVWCLWNVEEVRIELSYVHNFFLHLLVLSTGGKIWELTAVYTPSDATRRRVFWDKLEELKWKTLGFSWATSTMFCMMKRDYLIRGRRQNFKHGRARGA